MGRGEHGEDGREVDVAQEEVEREETQGDQVLRGIWKFSGQAIFLALHLYLEWTPSSNVLEDVIKVLDNFFLYVFHDQ